MRVVLIGSVNSSLHTLNKLICYNFKLVGVFGFEPTDASKVSGWVSMREKCEKNNIKYFPFKKINDSDNIIKIKKLKPSIIFVVGLSQLVSSSILSIPKLGCIGFHPTALPKGRGRAPMAWLILRENIGAATFFLIGEGTDDGPIFIQEFFNVSDIDTAKTIQEKILKSIDKALDKWLPNLKKGIWEPNPQDHSIAYAYEKRTPLDGWINWEKGTEEIDLLIRATTKPYPGAFTYYNDYKLVIWSARIEGNIKITGVNGYVLLVRDKALLVQTGNGLLWLLDYEFFDFNGKDVKISRPIKVGEKLGYNVEYEIFKLRNKLL